MDWFSSSATVERQKLESDKAYLFFVFTMGFTIVVVLVVGYLKSLALRNERLKIENEAELRRRQLAQEESRDEKDRAEEARQRAVDRDHEAMLQREKLAAEKLSAENEAELRRRQLAQDESLAEKSRIEQADQRAKDRDHEAALQREKLAAEKLSEERKLVAEQFSEERNLRLETTKLFTDVYKTAAGHSPVDMRILAGSLQESSQSVMMLCSQPGQGLAQFKLSSTRPVHSGPLSDVDVAALSCQSARQVPGVASSVAPSFDIVDADSMAHTDVVSEDIIEYHTVFAEVSSADGGHDAISGHTQRNVGMPSLEEDNASTGDERGGSSGRRKRGHGQRRRKQKWLNTVQAPTPSVRSNQN